LEEWLADNEVKTLEECKTWKKSVPVLQSPVIGIKVYSGSGCTGCRFSHERQREVETHMGKVHGIEDNVAPISCSVQRVFSSHLRVFWRIEASVDEDDQTDEGLFALRQFSREFQRFEQEDNRSTVGMYSSFIKVNG
jgi:hypothetical protein